ncbi:MAG: hypothetical protein ACJ78X_14980 [Myxococcales bacterium]
MNIVARSSLLLVTLLAFRAVAADAPADATASDSKAPVVEAAAPPQKFVNYGVGLRVGGGANLEQNNNTVGVTSLDVRPYINGQIHPLLKFSGNLDLNTADASRIRVLDAVAQFEPSQFFNIWFGRFLPPSDRANLSGPYYQNAWFYPDVVNGYPSIYAGRDDGFALWGQTGGGKFKYQTGVFTTNSNTPAKQGIYTGRLTYNFLDPEPGYYNSSTYYGTKSVLAVGGSVQYQRNGVTNTATATTKDLLGFNFDVLFERPLLGSDALTLEGSYYDFEEGDQGQSFFVLASYLVGQKLGFGKIQPMIRYQQFMPTGGGDSTRAIDGGLNYIIDGHNARLALTVQHRDLPAAASTTGIQFGVQIQQ